MKLKGLHFKSGKKAALLSVIGTLAIFLMSTQYTYAFDIVGSVGYGVVSTFAFGIGYVIAWVAGVVIAVEAWLIGIVLSINASVMQTAFVQTGFSVSLSVANLAFVLGIIVIALATILRLENYSIKKMLWKLVVMAILVNFGLVIINPIFGLSNSFTNYFLNCINPAAGGCNQNANGLSSFNNFATVMTQRFGPQKLLGTSLNLSNGGTGNGNGFGGISSASGAFSVSATGVNPAALSQMMIPIMALIFTIIDFLLLAFVMGAFVVMLIIRYVNIAILAILLPFAWAAWVFPSFSHLFSKWWNKFIQWTFFAPVFMFFVYLALATIGGANSTDAFTNATYTAASNPLWAAISNYFGQGISTVISSFMQELILAGLIIGGLIAADSLGVKFAGSAVSVVEKQAKTLGKFYGKQAGRAGFRAVGGNSLVKNMRTGNLGAPSFIRKIPLVGTAVDTTIRAATTAPGARRALSAAGRAIEPHLNNHDLVDERKKEVPHDYKLVQDRLKNDSMSLADTFAHIANLVEGGHFDDSVQVRGGGAMKWLDEHEHDVENYEFKKTAGDANKAVISDKAMRDSASAIEKLATDGKSGTQEMVTEQEKLRIATENFLGSLQKSDIAKSSSNDVLGKDDAISRALAKGFLTSAPHLVSSALPKMKGPALKKFHDIYENAYNTEVIKTGGDISIPENERNEKIAELKKRWDTFEKAMMNNALFSAGEGGGGVVGEAPAGPAPSAGGGPRPSGPAPSAPAAPSGPAPAHH